MFVNYESISKPPADLEQKTNWDSFERRLSAELVESVISQSLPMCTELLICCYFEKVHNFNDKYRNRIMKKLTKNKVRVIYTSAELVRNLRSS